MSSRNVTSKQQDTTMKLSIEDKCRIWRALASYIEECRMMAQDADDETLSVYYNGEINDARELRNLFRAHQFKEE